MVYTVLKGKKLEQELADNPERIRESEKILEQLKSGSKTINTLLDEKTPLALYGVRLNEENFFRYLRNSRAKQNSVSLLRLVNCKFERPAKQSVPVIKLSTIRQIDIFNCETVYPEGHADEHSEGRIKPDLCLEGAFSVLGIVMRDYSIEISVTCNGAVFNDLYQGGMSSNPAICFATYYVAVPKGSSFAGAFPAPLLLADGLVFYDHAPMLENVPEWGLRIEHYSHDAAYSNPVKSLVIQDGYHSVFLCQLKADGVRLHHSLKRLYIGMSDIGSCKSGLKSSFDPQKETSLVLSSSKFSKYINFDNLRLASSSYAVGTEFPVSCDKARSNSDFIRGRLSYLASEFQRVKKQEVADEINIAERSLYFQSRGFCPKVIWKLYGFLSNYGRSAFRPLLWLGALWFMSSIFYKAVEISDFISKSIFLSLPFLWPFFGKSFFPELGKASGFELFLFCTQYSLSAILWIMIILGVRYQFKVKF